MSQLVCVKCGELDPRTIVSENSGKTVYCGDCFLDLAKKRMTKQEREILKMIGRENRRRSGKA